MTITKGEFCRFSLNTRRQLLKEFGNYVCQVIVGRKSISVFKIYGFYVELVFNELSNQVERIQPIQNPNLITVYQEME
jgi:hypothetical protein